MAPTGGAGSLLGTPPVGGWNLIASGDFNGDGTDDLMWQNAGTGATSEWLMAGGSVASNPFTPAAPGWNVVAAGDLNGDAIDRLDVAERAHRRDQRMADGARRRRRRLHSHAAHLNHELAERVC